MIILSPAKSFSVPQEPGEGHFSTPQFWAEAQNLAEKMRSYSPQDLQKMMGVSEKIADLNVGRYRDFPDNLSLERGHRSAMLSFSGDVYKGFEAQNCTVEDLSWADQHIRILSGLYGILRPLDLMAEYRLEMGTPLDKWGGERLYNFWKEKVTDALSDQMRADEPLINLASEEYSSVIDFKKLGRRVITPVFKDFKNGQYKIISFYAKKARGMMARFVVDHRITDMEKLKNFDEYTYQPNFSDEDRWVFHRG